eukprot:gnl/MRDRNA2_/MRDRNA2_32799_c0_seq2.p1 gnl/MRDRNA2_/MRDRNA2_32799_c0~~gnl/MRDRNA2_/MRDRNA2_32799_c0_seq2.p1  ORF type:complete len:794 (+),score=175.99 gnl/MRDRNA2_/MRDRNA2_32799_c0_seq2:74-2455(+)
MVFQQPKTHALSMAMQEMSEGRGHGAFEEEQRHIVADPLLRGRFEDMDRVMSRLKIAAHQDDAATSGFQPESYKSESHHARLHHDVSKPNGAISEYTGGVPQLPVLPPPHSEPEADQEQLMRLPQQEQSGLLQQHARPGEEVEIRDQQRKADGPEDQQRLRQLISGLQDENLSVNDVLSLLENELRWPQGSNDAPHILPEWEAPTKPKDPMPQTAAQPHMNEQPVVRFEYSPGSRTLGPSAHGISPRSPAKAPLVVLSVEEQQLLTQGNHRQESTNQSITPPLLPGSNVSGGIEEGGPECGNCKVLQRQLRAVLQSLAGISSRIYHWSECLNIGRRQEILSLTLEYLRPCSHVDPALEQICSVLAAEFLKGSKSNTVQPRGEKQMWSWWDAKPNGFDSPSQKSYGNSGIAANTTAATKDFIPPEQIELRQAPTTIMSGIYKRTDTIVNDRVVYHQLTSDGDFYFVYCDDDVWALKQNNTGNPDDSMFIFCEESVPHPAACRSFWKTFVEETGEFKDDPSCLVRPYSGPTFSSIPEEGGGTQESELAVLDKVEMTHSGQEDLDGMYIKVANTLVNEQPVYFKADGADPTMGLYILVIDDGIWALKAELSGDNEDTLFAYTEDLEAETPANSHEPWLVFDASTGEFANVGAEVRAVKTASTIGSSSAAGNSDLSAELRQKAVRCLLSHGGQCTFVEAAAALGLKQGSPEYNEGLKVLREVADMDTIKGRPMLKLKPEYNQAVHQPAVDSGGRGAAIAPAIDSSEPLSAYGREETSSSQSGKQLRGFKPASMRLGS